MYEYAVHSPRLDTVLLVEDAIRDSKRDLTRTGLHRALEGRVMYQTLKVILDYLEKSHKIIYVGNKIVWIFTNEKLDRAVLNGREYLKDEPSSDRKPGIRLAVRPAGGIRKEGKRRKPVTA